MTRILITRPKEEEAELARLLQSRGHQIFSEPLLKTEFLPQNARLLQAALARKPQAILVTSKRAIEALSALCDDRNTPVFCVGEATASCARERGYKVAAFGENTAALAKRIKEYKLNHSRQLLYVRGEDISTDLEALLASHGFHTDSVIAYRAVAAQAFSHPLSMAIKNGDISGVMFFSRRTAQCYYTLACSQGLEGAHSTMQAFCISAQVTDEIRILPWQAVHQAEAPSQESMLKLLNSLHAASS